MDKIPIRPSTHIIGDVGQTAVALMLKEWGWTADIIASDYGEDLDCNIFVSNRRTNLHFRCQVKSLLNAGESVKQLESGDFSISIATSTCKAWLLSYFPVLLVIYDQATKQAFWADATEQVRSKMDRLSQDTLTLNVRRQELLEHSQTKIIDVVQSFYARLLRLSSTALACHIHPVLMPGYRAISFREIYNVKVPDASSNLIKLRGNHKDKDHLPAWTAALKTLDQHFITGWEAEAEVSDINTFTDQLRETLQNLAFPIAAGEWVSFICSPVKFSAKDDAGTKSSFWNRELTGWWSYTLINSTIISDGEYAFSPPQGFLRQIARRARSWEHYHHVDPQRDIAIQLFASVAATPGYKSDSASIRQHALGQFLPWKCRIEDTKKLNELLHPLGLVFRKVELPSVTEGYDTGVICTFFFEPGVGLFSLAQSWNEFQTGSVLAKLESSGLSDKLPGEKGHKEISDAVIGMFGDTMEDPPDSFMITERNYIPGLPLDLMKREVVVQRFREIGELDETHANRILNECKENILKEQPLLQSLELSFQLFEAWPSEHIAELAISWQPLLVESSAQSFDRLAPLIIKAFDAILPPGYTDQREFKTTHDVLRYVGELYFEGDESALYWNRDKTES